MIRPALRTLPSAILALSVAATLAVAAWLIPFSHPMGDDFCNAADARELGLWGASTNDYLHWGGRWASSLAAYGFPLLVDVTRWYPAGLAVVLGIAVVAVWFLLDSVMRLGRRRWSIALALTFFAVYWAGMPHPGQTVYWIDGAFIYSLNLSLGLVLVGCLLRLPTQAGRWRRPAILGLSLLAAFTAGLHELVALALVAALGIGTGVTRFLRDPRWVAWAGAAGGAILGLSAVVLAPGIEVRLPTLNREGPTVLGAVGAVLQMGIRILDAPGTREAVGRSSPLGWIVDAKLLAATLLLITAGPVRSWRPAWLDRRPLLWRWIAPLATLLVLLGSLLIGGWALGRTLPLRAFNALYLIFLLGWFVSVLVYTRGDAIGRTPDLLRGGSAVILALALLVSSNVKLAVRDIWSGQAARYDRMMTSRYEGARRGRAAGDVELTVEEIEPWPSSFFANDLRQDPRAFQNQCMARYFDLDVVRLATTHGGQVSTAR